VFDCICNAVTCDDSDDAKSLPSVLPGRAVSAWLDDDALLDEIDENRLKSVLTIANGDMEPPAVCVSIQHPFFGCCLRHVAIGMQVSRLFVIDCLAM
jgi:hypothetical protein